MALSNFLAKLYLYGNLDANSFYSFIVLGI